MNKLSECSTNNRRDFIKTTSSATAASVLAGAAIPRVHSAVDDTTQVALIGAGGRGTGRAAVRTVAAVGEPRCARAL